MEERHPHCTLAVLGGSSGRGAEDAYSDLDLVVLDDSAEYPYHRTYLQCGRNLECFVLTTAASRPILDAGIQAANPSLQRMLSEGWLIRCEPEGRFLLEEAREDLAYGPMPWSAGEIDRARFTLTERMQDVQGVGKKGERWFVAHQIAVQGSEFLLRVNRQWIAEGKHLFRALAAFDPAAAAQLESALAAMYGGDDPAPLLAWGARILDPYGGPLLEGFEERFIEE